MVEATSNADLAPTDYFLVSCDLVDDGMKVGNRQAQIIGKVPITSKAGSLIIYQPDRPPSFACEMLRNQPTRTIRFGLLNDDLTPYNTGGNNWSVDVRVRYLVPWNSE